MLDALIRSYVPYEHEGKTYELLPFTHQQFAEFTSAVRWRPYKELLKLGDCSKEILDEERREAAHKELGHSSPEVNQAAESAWGTVELVYLSLKPRQPEITRELIGSWDSLVVARLRDLALAISEPWISSGPTHKKKAALVAKCKTGREVLEALEKMEAENLAKLTEVVTLTKKMTALEQEVRLTLVPDATRSKEIDQEKQALLNELTKILEETIPTPT